MDSDETGKRIFLLTECALGLKTTRILVIFEYFVALQTEMFDRSQKEKLEPSDP